MSPTATVRVLPAEEIAARAGGSTPPLRWPERATFFAERAMRLRQLANGHAMGDFLQFVARLAQAQQTQLERLGQAGAAEGIPVPDAAALDRASMAGLPPLSGADWPRHAAWHGVLRAIVQAMRAETPPGAAADALARLHAADDVFLERQADALLTGVMSGLDLAAAPVVAASLQVLWTHTALELAKAHAARSAPGSAATSVLGKLDDDGQCPCCGSRPVASITRNAGKTSGQRYLHCSLCGLEWNVPRGRCTHCGAAGAEKVSYQSLDRADVEPDEDVSARAAKAAIQAESCDACGHYLKIVHGDRDPLAEPAADDLASITLDLLVAETGLQRHGVNLMLLFGEPEEAAAGDAGGRPEPPGTATAPPRAGR